MKKGWDLENNGRECVILPQKKNVEQMILKYNGYSDILRLAKK